MSAHLRNQGSHPKIAMAVAAHPDDIEFMMAGTLLLLKQAGYEIHYMNLASGNCGSVQHNAARTRAIRRYEARRSAEVLGAHYHPSLTADLEIFYDDRTLRRLVAIIREVEPTILLTQSPQDYMEDHMNTSRLIVTAAFARGMPNYRAQPPRPPTNQPVTVYHAMPHGLCDPLRRRVVPGAFVNTTSVHLKKKEALAAHESQKNWLDVSQGLNSYLQAMEKMSLALGKMSGRFRHAEGWRRHLHLGFSEREIDPLQDLGRNYLINSTYEENLQ
jgi:LmbE family N-acetylglucosaminyl deacetylase